MSRLLFVFLVCDMIFLPMLHVYGLPFKIGYLVLVLLFLVNIPRRGYVWGLMALFACLALATLGGWLAGTWSQEHGAFDNTRTMVASYMVAPMGLVLGARMDVRVLRYVPFIVIAYFAANILVILWWDRLVGTPFGDLYWYMPDWLGAGVSQVRAGGLHQNPNISALMMSVLLVGMFVGIKYRQLDPKGVLVLLALILALLLPFAVASRNQTLLSLLIVVAIVLTLWRTRRGAAALRLVILGGVILTVAIMTVSTWMPNVIRAPTVQMREAITQFWREPLHETQGLGRPFRGWLDGLVPARVARSPIIGTGGEGAAYHNDWFAILAASGVVGLLLFTLIVAGVAKIELVFLLPFLITANPTTFVFVPQALVVFLMFVGMAWRLKTRDVRLAKAPAAGQIGPPPQGR